MLSVKFGSNCSIDSEEDENHEKFTNLQQQRCTTNKFRSEKIIKASAQVSLKQQLPKNPWFFWKREKGMNTENIKWKCTCMKTLVSNCPFKHPQNLKTFFSRRMLSSIHIIYKSFDHHEWTVSVSQGSCCSNKISPKRR